MGRKLLGLSYKRTVVQEMPEEERALRVEKWTEREGEGIET